MRASTCLLLALSLPGCAFISEDHAQWRLDPDGDGVSLEEDCDSDDRAVGGPSSWYADLDGDGYGDEANPVQACEQPAGAVLQTGDCWDDPAATPEEFTALNGLPQPAAGEVYPGAANAPYDGINQGCDADFSALDDFDVDGDAHASAHYADRDGLVGDDCVDGGDLDDPNPAGIDADEIYPGAAEDWYDGTDADCDGEDCDADGDSYDGGVGSDHCEAIDCDDADPTVLPDPTTAEVFYNGIDDNCDLSDGDGDADGDGYWAADYAAQAPGSPLEIPAGQEGDCWDDPSGSPSDFTALPGYAQPAAGEVNPAADELWYDGVDQDCDGASDGDADGDGYDYQGYEGESELAATDCYDQIDQPFSNPTNTDPALVNPGAPELWYDGTDADCDGNDCDADGDGFDGSDGSGWCDEEDCDDDAAATNPGAAETCLTSADDDCDGDSNEKGALACDPYYTDADGDGYGVGASACLCAGEGDQTASEDGDCDDAESARNPGSSEICGDGIADNNCDAADDDTCELGDMSLADADVKLRGEAEYDHAGTSLGTGDLDGDGAADLVVGAYDAYDQLGAAYVVSGPISAGIAADLSAAGAEVTGSSKEDYVGRILSVGDADGDGYDDLLLGSYTSSLGGTYSGAAFLVRGPLSGSSSVSTAEATLVGSASYDYAGAAVDLSGDNNGDGNADALLSATGAEFGPYSTNGAVYLLSGPLSGTYDLDSDAEAVILGENDQDRLGVGLAWAGDIDGDGREDALLGSAGADDDAEEGGAAYAFYGPISGFYFASDADVVLAGEQKGDQAGEVVAAAGDADDDGYDDVLIGAPSADYGGYQPGKAYLLYGAALASGSLGGADATFVGSEDGDRLGFALAGGDVDGDGYADALLGAPNADAINGGAAYLFRGPLYGAYFATDGADLVAEEDSDLGGSALLAGADLSGDGVGDLAVGAADQDEGFEDSGAAYLIFGVGE